MTDWINEYVNVMFMYRLVAVVRVRPRREEESIAERSFAGTKLGSYIETEKQILKYCIT